MASSNLKTILFFFVMIFSFIIVHLMITYANTFPGLAPLEIIPFHTEIPVDFRQRYESWYNARPDITSRIGVEQGTNSTKYLIFRCDKRWACGGWGSRIIGMTQGYLIANLTGRNFKIELLDPNCSLHNLFLPHKVNWSLPTSFHSNPTASNPDIRTINYMSNRNVYNKINNMNLTQTLGDRKYVYFRTDLIYSEGFQNSSFYSKELSWMYSLTRGEILSTTFKHLLKPTPQLFQAVKKYLSSILQEPDDKLICTHIRMGRNPTIPNDSAIRTTMKHLPAVWSFLREHSTEDVHKIFIMTDSTEVLKAARNQSFAKRLVHDSPGKVAHIERGKNLPMEDRCDALHKVIFDHQVLINCDILLISLSSLSRIAAYTRDSDNGLYCLLLSGKIVPCKTSNIIQVYNIIG